MNIIHTPLRQPNTEIKSYKSIKALHNGRLVVVTPTEINHNTFLELLTEQSDNFRVLSNASVIIVTVSVRFNVDSSDIFKYLRPSVLNSLKKNKTIFIFDMSSEGHSPHSEFPIFFPIFEKLYQSCKIHNVDTSNVVFLSSNLRDEQNNIAYANRHNFSPINVCSYLYFEKIMNTTIIPMCQLSNNDTRSLESKYLDAVKSSTDHHTDKIFSSLSRVNRNYRSVATFLLYHSDIRDAGLISHNKFSKSFDPSENPLKWRSANQLSDYSDHHVLDWCNNLPLIVDQTEFDVNWVLRPYHQIHDQTIFQIVNETLVDDYDNTTLFYSEKTFRPISCFQPFVIYGQPGCNRYLKELGYQLYDEWFDLSFDDVEDPVERYRQLLCSIVPVVKMLKNMSSTERIAWRFKNPEILKHNYQVMITNSYSKNKFLTLFQNLEKTLSR
jgi:hypothetical protein